MKAKSEDYEIKFWKEWVNADCLKRHDLVKKLPFFKMCLQMKDNKLFWHSFATMLNGYFEDLESAVYTKIRIEDQKRKKKREK